MLSKSKLLERIEKLEKRIESMSDDVVHCRNLYIPQPPSTYDYGDGPRQHPEPDAMIAVKDVVELLLEHLELEPIPQRQTYASTPARLERKKK